MNNNIIYLNQVDTAIVTGGQGQCNQGLCLVIAHGGETPVPSLQISSSITNKFSAVLICLCGLALGYL